MDYVEVKDLLNSAKNIVITTHYRPDGDAVGSSMALFHVLKQLNKNVTVVFPSGYANFLAWMPDLGENIVYDDSKESTVSNLITEADVLFSLDYNSPERTNKLSPMLLEAKGQKIIIDHHPEPNMEYANHVFSDISYSSTCEMLYDFFTRCGYDDLINTTVTNCLYTGILTDTGRFKYACSARLMHVVSKLYEKGLEDLKVIDQVFDSEPLTKLQFQSHCILNRMQIFEEKGAAIIYATEEDFKRFKYEPGFTEGLVNYPLQIKGVGFSAFVAPAEKFSKISLRSKGDFAVNSIANEHFNGGGHKNAAGGIYYANVKSTVNALKDIINALN